MTYLEVKWIHSYPDEPVLIYSELDHERWELRKVEVFRSGRMGYADPEVEVGGTGLSETPLPSFEEIAVHPKFEPEVISKAEFEKSGQRRQRESILCVADADHRQPETLIRRPGSFCVRWRPRTATRPKTISSAGEGADRSGRRRKQDADRAAAGAERGDPSAGESADGSRIGKAQG